MCVRRGSSFFKLDRFLPNLVQSYRCAIRREYSRRFAAIPKSSNRFSVKTRIEPFLQRDKSHCGFLASVATFEGKFPNFDYTFLDLLSNVDRVSLRVFIVQFSILKSIYFFSPECFTSSGEGKRLINSSFISGCRARSTVHQGTQEPCRIYRA